MSRLTKNALTRGLKRAWTNHWIRQRNEGLSIGSGVSITKSSFGRYNMICDGATITNSTLDDFSYIGTSSNVSNATIGKFCSIGPSVMISLGIHPSRDFVSTHPVFYSTTFRCKKRFATKQAFVEHGPVTIEHDVWIGAGAIIPDNVTIATGAIVAAGAIVTKDIEPYSIVGGSPARLIRKRFSDPQIQQLLDSKWWDLDLQTLSENHTAFHNIDTFLKKMIGSKKTV